MFPSPFTCWEGELDQARMGAVLRGHAGDEEAVALGNVEAITPRPRTPPVEQVA